MLNFNKAVGREPSGITGRLFFCLQINILTPFGAHGIKVFIENGFQYQL